LSGPLLDRLDLLVHMERTRADYLAGKSSTSSARAQTQVIEARERQASRLHEEGILVNAHMDARMLRRHVRLDDAAQKMLAHTRDRGVLSARGQHRLLRVARTIADLDSRERIGAEHLSQALALRPEAGLSGRRAA
jgi:magnesium chelatase family protein